MLKKEFSTVLHSYRLKIVFLVLLAIVIIDLILGWFGSYESFAVYKMIIKDPEWLADMPHPVMGAVLSGLNRGRLMQIMLKWILPVYFLFLYSDSVISEKNSGYVQTLLTRASRKNIIRSKYCVSFFVPFLIALVVLIINLAGSIAIFHGQSFMGMEQHIEFRHGLLKLMLYHPWQTYFIFMLLFSSVAGCGGLISTAICLLFPNYLIAYPAVLFLWFLLINNRYTVISLTQPFSYSYRETLYAMIILAVITAVIMAVAWIVRRKSDEY